MSDTLIITLADTQYTIRKLTLRQARDLGIGATAFVGSADERFSALVDHAVSVVVLALSRDHPTLTADAILELETTPAEIITAYAAVMKFAGFVAKKANGAGEAQAAPASTGAASSPASLPH